MTPIIFRFALLSILVVFAGLTHAQEQVNMRVFTEPPGAGFYVDGRYYTGPATFLWPVGSKHNLSILPTQTSALGGRRFTFLNWTDNTGTLTTATPGIAVTASASVTSLRATVQLEYEVQIKFFDCPVNQQCQAPGTVEVSGQTLLRGTALWFAPDTLLSLAAFPNPGYVFAGWGGQVSNTSAFVATHTVKGPVVISAEFAPARRVTFATEPPELEILLDRSPIRTPVTLDLGKGTRHLLAAPAFQYDKWSNLWVLDSFSTGGAQNSLYTVDSSNTPETITAKFIPAARVSFVTTPVNLRLRVDGRENWAAYNFVWALGSKHTVTALPDQLDSKGQRYVFAGWSNEGPASQEIAIDESTAANGLRLVARYEAQTRLTIQSTPVGMPIQVDGAECRTPCAVDRPAGAEVRIAPAANVAVTDQTRMEFENWVDGGSASRTIALGSESRTIAARYRPAHRLTAFSEPENGAGIRAEPPSADGFYPDGAQITLTAESKPGFTFRRWDGDIGGVYRAAVVSMTGPRVARALLDRSPYIHPAGVRNAAAELPEPGVSAGSLIAITGASLSLIQEAGPANPLAQTIAGVTVRVESSFLPLLFVSPGLINAQLPSGLAEGEYTLKVNVSGLPEVTSRLKVVRNAPGLFGQEMEGRVYASALHEDGSAVTLDSRARQGEKVTLLGTGFGPYRVPTPDGFPVPASAAFVLDDPVEVVGADLTLQPEWTGAAPGLTGVTATRFRIESSVPSGSIELKVRVNGRESNSVWLPVE